MIQARKTYLFKLMADVLRLEGICSVFCFGKKCSFAKIIMQQHSLLPCEVRHVLITFNLAFK